jgi:hypothetical protein
LVLPNNIDFLPGAAKEFARLRRESPEAYAAVLRALISLARAGPPADTRYVPVQEPPFPNTLAYRFEAGGRTLVFESNQRILMQTRSGVRIARALRGEGARARYTVWAILDLH